MLLGHVQKYGDEATAKFGYMVPPKKVSIQELPMFSKLCGKLSEFSGSTRHVVLMYGSSPGAGNCLFTDVDMMAFVDDNVCTPDKASELKGLFERTMV